MCIVLCYKKLDIYYVLFIVEVVDALFILFGNVDLT